MSFLVAMGSGDPLPWVRAFEGLLPDRRIYRLGDAFDPAEIEFVMTWYQPPGSLANLPSLKAIFSLGAGVDHMFRDAALPNVALARVVDPDLTTRMSEYVMQHVLNITRQARLYRERQAQGLWRDEDDQPAARDVRVGIMGMGVLGTDAAIKLKVLGFDVAGWSTSPKSLEGIPTFAGPDALAAFLGRTDILVTLLPLTSATRGMIGRSVFSGLSRTGRVPAPSYINPGRGGLQVEADILACLDDGTLHEVVLDVFETEPLPPSSPFWAHPCVTVTPHNASISDPAAVARAIVAQVHRAERGEPLLNRVDFGRGY